MEHEKHLCLIELSNSITNPYRANAWYTLTFEFNCDSDY